MSDTNLQATVSDEEYAKLKAQQAEQGIDLDKIKQLYQHQQELTEGPVILTSGQFRPFIPLFQSHAVLSDDDRRTLTAKYLPLIAWGYRPVEITADIDGEVKTILKLPRLFTQTSTPFTTDHGLLSAVHGKAGQAQRPDHRTAAFQKYMDSFLNSQINDRVLDAISEARTETDEILRFFAQQTGVSLTGDSGDSVSPTDDGWDIEDTGD